ncbi:MAG: alpha/beta hydrolase [Bacteroidetes bacterium]|nr:alpha/beta hydrolase [Bacteroidota bacterium]
MKNIILLHGAIGAADQLIPLENELTKQNFKVFKFSFSGHGNTPFNNDFSIKQFAKELELFISENNLIQPAIFGYSMGGYVALYLATQMPMLIGNIITLGTKFNWTEEIAKKEIQLLNPQTIIEKVPKFANALQQRHGDCWINLLNKTSQLMVELGQTNLLNEDNLNQINNKVILGLADNDNMVTDEETTSVFKTLKNAQRFYLKNTKHQIESVNVTELCDLIIAM